MPYSLACSTAMPTDRLPFLYRHVRLEFRPLAPRRKSTSARLGGKTVSKPPDCPFFRPMCNSLDTDASVHQPSSPHPLVWGSCHSLSLWVFLAWRRAESFYRVTPDLAEQFNSCTPLSSLCLVTSDLHPHTRRAFLPKTATHAHGHPQRHLLWSSSS